MSKEKITGSRIKQARQIRGYSTEELAEKVRCKPHKLVRYETDLEQPPVAVMDSIAIITGFPPAFFRQPPGPQFPMGSLLFHSLTCKWCFASLSSPGEAHECDGDESL